MILTVTKSEKFQHFIHLPLLSLHHLLIQTKTQKFLPLYRNDKRKCPRFYGWMSQCKRLIQFHIISTEYVYKIKARNTVLRLEALKDGKKWNKDSTTQWTGFASVRYRVCSGGYTCPNTECLFFKQLLSLWESPIMLGKLQM